jgi:hypothetical protein
MHAASSRVENSAQFVHDLSKLVFQGELDLDDGESQE